MKKIIIALIVIILIAPTFSATDVESIFIGDASKGDIVKNVRNNHIQPTFFGKTYMVEMRDE